jgi:hypothetical protein
MKGTLVKGLTALTLSVLMASVVASSAPAFAINGHGISYGPQFGAGPWLAYKDGLKINGATFDISQGKTTTIKTQGLYVNSPSDITLKIFHHASAQNIQHVGIFMNLHSSDPKAYQSDTEIEWSKNSGTAKLDPNGVFKSVTTTVKYDGTLMYLTFHVVPNKTMDTSHIIVRAWDNNLSSGEVSIHNAIMIGYMPTTFSSMSK